MKNIKTKILAIILSVVAVALVFAGCDKGGDNSGDTAVKQEVIDLTGVDSANATLKMSVLYTDNATRMKYDSTYTPYASTADNTRYQAGDWKPTWKELTNRLNFKIEDATPEKAGSVSEAFKLLQANKFSAVNVLSGPVSSIVDEGTKNNTFVDLTNYKEELPNFFNFLESNEIVEKSITSDNGAIYYAPYFDGFDDIETMFICRQDWVEKLLDDEIHTYVIDETTGTQKLVGTAVPNTPVYDTVRTLSKNTNKAEYQGYYDSMDTTYKAANADGTSAVDVHVSYTSGNGIIALQNALATKNGKALTETLKSYIKTNYIDKGYITKPSELFCGQNACYNADELIALWRCVYTNPALLTGNASSDIVPFYPRTRTADRANQVLQLVQLWGVRGYESRNGYFYFDEAGELQDARISDDMMQGLLFLNQLYQEGLILHDYMKDVRTMEHREYYNQQNLGFMTYDYNQTTSIYNETLNDSQTPSRFITPILFPVADWDNKATLASGKTNSYNVSTNCLYQYTESWRSVKTEGWAITYNTATSNKAAFKKALELFDYMYTTKGQTLMTYGPDSYIETKADGTYETISYKGVSYPKISTKALTELKNKNLGKGNYTNYYRYYVGSTLPIGFVKIQAMEYQTVDIKGLVGLDHINKAYALGTLQHATVVRNTAKIQNSLVPTTFSLSEEQTNTVNNQTLDLGNNFNNSSAAGQNVFHNYVMNGFGSSTTKSKEDLVEQIKTDWKLNTYLRIHQSAYKKMYSLN